MTMGFTLLLCAVVFSFVLEQSSVPASAAQLHRNPLYQPKPKPDAVAATARWLVEQNSWGVLSTISIDLQGAPFGNVASYSDGLPDEGLGIPYFYLTYLDPTARDVVIDDRVSFTISEFSVGSCGKLDPEDPACARLTLNGKLKLVDSESSEGQFARRALFAKHAEMQDWPKNHNFKIFKLDIENIFLVDWFGGAKPLSVSEYLNFTRNDQFPSF